MNYQLAARTIDGSSFNRPVPPLGYRQLQRPRPDHFVQQYAPPFHAPYVGTNSLPRTWAARPGTSRLSRPSALAGRRVLDQSRNRSGLRPEQHARPGGLFQRRSLQGRQQLSLLRGCRAPSCARPSTSAATPRKSMPTSTSSPARRPPTGWSLTVGKFSVADIFDTNKYAHDPRSDFLNWTLVDAGTFDYAADAWGFTYGAAAEWYQGDWTLRGGVFDLSIVPNSDRTRSAPSAVPAGRRNRAPLSSCGASPARSRSPAF